MHLTQNSYQHFKIKEKDMA
jgi:hypothetical protein